MIIKQWNIGADWWFVPSIFVKNTKLIFEFGFRFLKFEFDYFRCKDVSNEED